MKEEIQVLCIDDDPDFIDRLSQYLRMDHCDVYSANDGRTGLELIRTAHPDLVLLDVMLPGYNGFELCRIIKGDPATCGIPVVMISGVNISSDHQADGLEIGADGYLVKTMPAREMRARLKVFIQNRQYEKAISKNEERFRDLFEKAPLGYQSLDFDGRFLEVNRTWLETLGYGRDEVIGKWFGDFLAPEFVEAFRERFPVFKAQGQIHSEFYMIHKDGSKRFIAFDGRIGYNPDGSFRQTHCIFRDDSERRQAEILMKEQLQELLRWQEVMLDREDRIQELKREVNTLCLSLGRPPRYPSQETAKENRPDTITET